MGKAEYHFPRGLMSGQLARSGGANAFGSRQGLIGRRRCDCTDLRGCDGKGWCKARGQVNTVTWRLNSAPGS